MVSARTPQRHLRLERERGLVDQLAAARARRERADQHLPFAVDHDRQVSRAPSMVWPLPLFAKSLLYSTGVDRPPPSPRPPSCRRAPTSGSVNVDLGTDRRSAGRRAARRGPRRHQALVVGDVGELQPAGRVARDEQSRRPRGTARPRRAPRARPASRRPPRRRARGGRRRGARRPAAARRPRRWCRRTGARCGPAPPVETDSARAPYRMSTPSSVSCSATAFDDSGWSRGRMRSPPRRS